MRQLQIRQLARAPARVIFCAGVGLLALFSVHSFAQNPTSSPNQISPSTPATVPASDKYQVSSNNAQNKDEKSEKMLQRLEQLFIWRVSDRLSLTPQQESDFSTQFRKISQERTNLSRQLDSILGQIEKEKGNSTKEVKLIADYEGTLKKYDQCQTKEMDVMRHLFDTKKMVDYMLLKRDMSLKIKDVLVQPRSGSKEAQRVPLKEPQVIQEK